MNLFGNIRADLATYEGRWSSQGFWVMIVYRLDDGAIPSGAE